MKSVFLVQHLHLLENDREDIKCIGIYRSRETACAAIDRLKDKPGFRNFPRIIDPRTDDQVQGFYIDEYSLDKDNWTDGFATWQPLF